MHRVRYELSYNSLRLWNIIEDGGVAYPTIGQDTGGACTRGNLFAWLGASSLVEGLFCKEISGHYGHTPRNHSEKETDKWGPHNHGILRHSKFWKLLWLFFCLCKLLSAKWRWSKTCYDSFFRLGVDMWKFLVQKHPLREEYFENFNHVTNRVQRTVMEQVEHILILIQRIHENRRDGIIAPFRREQFSVTMPPSELRRI